MIFDRAKSKSAAKPFIFDFPRMVLAWDPMPDNTFAVFECVEMLRFQPDPSQCTRLLRNFDAFRINSIASKPFASPWSNFPATDNQPPATRVMAQFEFAS